MDKRAYFEDLASRWDRLPAAPDAPVRTRRFVERMALAGARRVVDVGCGTGVLVTDLSLALPGARIVELDLALAMVRESVRKHRAPGVAGVCGDAGRLPLAPASCDAVVCFGVLPHLGDLTRVMPELLRPLRPGGIIAIGHTMDSRELNAFHAALGEPVAADYLPPASVLGDLLHRAGARSIVAEEQPGWYFVRAEAGCLTWS
jgi:ubiquinone/menaquinone biosynthesis C-methylase UbiE